MDDDGDVDTDDQTLFDAKSPTWSGIPQVTVAQAFSDVGNPFMFQGRVHFALDTEEDATEGELLLNDHRARMTDCPTGRWNTKDPLGYNRLILYSRITPLMRRYANEPEQAVTPYEYINSNPVNHSDANGLFGVPIDLTDLIGDILGDSDFGECGACYDINPRASIDCGIIVSDLVGSDCLSVEEHEDQLCDLVRLAYNPGLLLGHSSSCKKGCKCTDKRTLSRDTYCFYKVFSDMPVFVDPTKDCKATLDVGLQAELDGWIGKCKKCN